MGMFDMFTDPIETGFDVIGDILDGDMPNTRDVASLISAGLTVGAISEITGVATDVIESMIKD